MKAIKVSQKLKDDNPNLFKNYEVGQIARINIPNVFVRDGKKILGYNFNDEQQSQDGFKELVTPTYDSNTQKLGKLIEKNKSFTYEVLDLTHKELDSQIIKQVPKLYFKLKLLGLDIVTGVQGKDDDVLLALDLAKNNNIITDDQYNSLALKWTENNVVERDNEDLFNLIPVLNQIKIEQNPSFTPINNDNIIQIFKDYA